MTGICYFSAGADNYDLTNQVNAITESLDNATSYVIDDKMPSYEGLDEMLQKADADGCTKVVVLAEENNCINLENAIREEYHFNEVEVLPEQFYRMTENDQVAQQQQTQQKQVKPAKALNGRLFLVECQANFPTPKNLTNFYKVLTAINQQYKQLGTVKFFFGDFIEGQQFMKCESVKSMMETKILKNFDAQLKGMKSSIGICDCSAQYLQQFATSVVNESDCSAAQITLVTCQEAIANAARSIPGGQITQNGGGTPVKFDVIVDKRLATYDAGRNKKIYDACVKINKKTTTKRTDTIDDKVINEEVQTGRSDYVQKLCSSISWFEQHKNQRTSYDKRSEYENQAMKAAVAFLTSDLKGVADEFHKSFGPLMDIGTALVKDAKANAKELGKSSPKDPKQKAMLDMVQTKEYETIVKEAELQ